MHTMNFLLALAAAFAPSAAEPDKDESVHTDAPGEGARTIFPHLRIHTAERWLELDGFVPITVDDPDAPLVYLEQIVCGRESPEIPAGKEHESLVTTNAKGSHIHAGLLLLGLEPGSPVKWETDPEGAVIAVEPTGPPVRVEFFWTDEAGEQQKAPPQDWVRHSETHERFRDGHWVFSGSMFVNYGAGDVYDADRSGTIVGLTSFGGEVLSWNSAIHHDSGVATPVWSANNDTVPPFKTKVRVRLTVLEEEQQPETAPEDSPPIVPEDGGGGDQEK